MKSLGTDFGYPTDHPSHPAMKAKYTNICKNVTKIEK